MARTVRIGIVGAGAFTTNRMLPGFQKLPDVEVSVIANRRRESAEKVAADFAIPEVVDDYRGVIGNSNVDAVLIGTPPAQHREIVLAALDAGKHVICQTRMATTAADALVMHEHAEKAQQRGIVAMLVPPAPFYRGSRFVDHLLHSGFLGRLRQVQAFNVNSSAAKPDTPLSSGRNDIDLYGPFNAAQLGLTYDVISRWTGSATSVVAQRATFEPVRPLTPEGPLVQSPYPDAVTVLAETESGAVALNMINYSIYFADSRIELYGSEGTVVYRLKGDAIFAARAGETELKQLPVPPEHDNPWSVEDEFIRLIREGSGNPSFSFRDGVRNMQYLEAAYYAATEGRRVALP